MTSFESIWPQIADIRGWYNERESRCLYGAAVQGAQVGDLMEIGVYRGHTAKMLGIVAADAGRTVHCIDPFWLLAQDWSDSDMHIISQGEHFNLDALVEFTQHMTGLPSRLTIGTVKDFPEQEARFGLIHVDGEHSTGILADAPFAARHVAPGGLVVFHDCHEWGLELFPNILAAVNRLLSEGYENVAQCESVQVVRRPL